MAQQYFERNKAELVARLDAQEMLIEETRRNFAPNFNVPNKLLAVPRTKKETVRQLSALLPAFRIKPKGRAFGKKG